MSSNPSNSTHRNRTMENVGSCLRSGDCTPASISFKSACLGSDNLKGRSGRPRANLCDLVLSDLRDRTMDIDDERSFNYVVAKAMDRALWRNLE